LRLREILVTIVTCNYSYHQKLQWASKCYLLMTAITLLLLMATVGAIAVSGYATIDKGREERPPSTKRDGGASATRSSSPRPSPSPAAPELAPCPRDPFPGPAATAAALLFLPPALSLVHPTLYLPASILLTPARNSVSLPAPPWSPPVGDNDADDDQRSVNTTMEPSPEDFRPRATQSTASSSTPPTTGGGGVQNTAPCRSRDHAATLSGTTSARSYLVVVIVSRRLLGGAEAEVVVVAGRRGSSRRGSGGGDNRVMFCVVLRSR
jgi:hypothetical protein